MKQAAISCPDLCRYDPSQKGVQRPITCSNSLRNAVFLMSLEGFSLQLYLSAIPSIATQSGHEL